MTFRSRAARTYSDALDEVNRRISQDTGLRREEIDLIRDASTAEAAGLRIGKDKSDILAGYIPSLIAARNASDKANDAEQKEADALAKKTDGLRDALGTINDRLDSQRAKLVEAQNSTDPSKSAQIAKIESDIDATLKEAERR